MKEGEGNSQRTDKNDRDGDNSVVMARGKGDRGWVEVGQEGENGGICNSVNNKNKVKKRNEKTQEKDFDFLFCLKIPNRKSCFKKVSQGFTLA